MEKIKSRWRKNYLEGDIINNDDAKDDSSGPGGYQLSASNNHRHHHDHIDTLDHNHHHQHNNSNISSFNINNSNSHHHHHHHHHNHHNHNHHNHRNHHHHNHHLTTNNNMDNTNATSNTNNSNSNNHNNSSSNSNSTSKNSTPPTYEPLIENLYLDKRKNEHSRSRKDARAMVCDCILTKEERSRGIMGCLDDCLNRMLMIECGPKCTLGDHCLNKRFQKCQSAKVEVFKTRKKGWGLRALTELPNNSFIMEYVGEVVRAKEFRSRVKKYTKQKIKHHYFMALRSDEIIDATVKGNLTRFINHSCEPNCETQKWTVNGDLRIGFFTIRDLQPGEEITFDYQFQRYGRKAQKCYCEAPSCRGYIGANEQTFSLNGNSSPQVSENKAHKKSYKHGLLVDVSLEDKITALAEDAAQGLKTKDQVIALASLSIKAEELADRIKLLELIKATKSEISLRLFVDYHGLEILSLWMRDPQADCDFKATIIDILERLPIQNKTKVLESNVYRMIERWATEETKIVLPTVTSEATNSDYTIETVKQSNQRKLQENEALKDSKESNVLAEPNPNVENSNNCQNQATTKEVAVSPSTILPLQNSNSPNIKSLANKLLKKFQALSPGFKIPRLNRLQRMEIEKKMDEEVISDDISANDKFNIEQKNPFDARNYFKSTPTTNGTSSNMITKNSTLPLKRKFDSLTTNNIDLTPAPKISKEEHRQQFEMHVRLKDYYDTIEKHYGAATVEQLKLSHRTYPNINGLQLPYPHLANQNLGYIGNNQHIVPSIAPLLVPPQTTQQPILPPSLSTNVPSSATGASSQLMYPNKSIEVEVRYQPPLVASGIQSTTNNYHLVGSHLATNGQQDLSMIAYQHTNGIDTIEDPYTDLFVQPKEKRSECITTDSTHDTELENFKPEPTNLPTLIVLANSSIEPVNTIDDALAFSICDYDEYYSIRDKPLGVEDVLDDQYPYPGSYYTTPSGETWFATVTLDRKTQQPRTVILNLQVRSEEDQLLLASPKHLSVTQNSLNTVDEQMIAPISSRIQATSTNANLAQATSSTDTVTESPTTNSGGDLPGKIKKKLFEHGVSKYIKDALSEYYKPDCQLARITSKEDFVFLARKLTLAVLEKELNRKGCERLECNKQVKRKVEDFVRIYMAKFGKLYTRQNKA